VPPLYKGKGKPEKGQLVVSTSVIFSQNREIISMAGPFVAWPEERHILIFDLWKYTTPDKFYGSNDHLGHCIGSFHATPVWGGYINTKFLNQRGTAYIFWLHENILGVVKGDLDIEDPKAVKRFLKLVAKKYHAQALDLFEKGLLHTG